jgi:hypothetical protein
LCNISINKTWFKAIAHTFGGIAGCVILDCFLTLYPAHNVFHYPEYWYEFPLQLAVALLPSWAAMVLLRCSNYMNIDSIKNIFNFVTMFITASVIILLLYASEYLVWTILLRYPYPMPFNGYLTAGTGMIVFYIILWFEFPVHWRQNELLRKRLISCIFAITLNQGCIFQYALITKILLTVPANLQWIVALFLPLVRELNIWVGIKWASKSSGGDIPRTVIGCIHAVSTTHALFLTYTVGSNATNVTSSLLLVTDFAINVFTCVRIIYIRYTVGRTNVLFENIIKALNP